MRSTARRAREILVAGIFAAASACGSATDPGSGTETLLATIETMADAESTRVEMELRADASPFVGAEVVFEDVLKKSQKHAESPAMGRYRVTFAGYARVLRVEISSGRDALRAQLEGPAPHAITRPPPEAIVRRGAFERLRVEWQADDRAESTLIAVDGILLADVPGDPLAVEIPLKDLSNGDHVLSVIRETSVDLRGGADGSRMSTRYEVDNRFSLEG